MLVRRLSICPFGPFATYNSQSTLPPRAGSVNQSALRGGAEAPDRTLAPAMAQRLTHMTSFVSRRLLRQTEKAA